MSVRIWSAGLILDPAEATVSLTGDAALRGISVFEGLMAYRRPGGSSYAVVSLASHLARLHRSAALMRLPIARLTDDVTDGVSALLAGETADQVYLRPTVYLAHGYYGGEAQTALFVSARAVESTGGWPFDCVISTLRHVPRTAYPHEAKVGALYAFYRLSRIEAAEAGADEAILLTTEGSISETPGASVFAVKAGTAYTPPVAAGILPSITRATAIEILANQLATKTVEGDIAPEFLATADEVFLTGTMDEIRPVRSIGGRTIGTASAPLTSRLRAAYLQACREGQPAPPAGTEFFEGSRCES